MPPLPRSGTRRPTHCPQCSTRVRGDVPWCLACYAPLHDGDPLPGEAARAPASTAGRRADPASDLDEIAAHMLAELAASGDRPTWAGRLPTTPAGRAVLIAGLLAVGCGVLLGAMALVGLAL